MWTPLPAYAELHCLSAFSFQRGASLPEELVQRAAALGYSALAITDECSVSGVVRAHTQAQESGIQLLPGAEFLVAPDATVAAPSEAAAAGRVVSHSSFPVFLSKALNFSSLVAAMNNSPPAVSTGPP